MEEKGGNKKMPENTSEAIDFNSFDDLFGNMFANDPSKTVDDSQHQISNEEAEVLVKEKKIEVQSTVSAQNSDIAQAVSKLTAIGNELSKEFVEREELINAMLLCVISGSNLLMLGDPGTGKSMISKALCSKIENANYFEYMLNKTSDPSEILGPFSVKEMEQDKFLRIISGKLPEADIAFIDEVYKSNAPTLNALLTIMNERIFYNNGKQPIPLLSMFAASNEPPEDDSLLALHDRFLFRINVEYIHNSKNRKKMFKNYIAKRSKLNGGMSGVASITLDEIHTLQESAMRIPIPSNMIDEFVKLLGNLDRRNSISVSDRRANECLKVLQSSALLNGRQRVSVEDFDALKFVLWSKDGDVKVITDEISKIANPWDKEYDSILKDFTSIKDSINNVSSQDEKNSSYLKYSTSLKALMGKANRILANMSSTGSDVKKITELRDEISQFNADMYSQTLGNTLEQFGIVMDDEDNAPSDTE